MHRLWYKVCQQGQVIDPPIPASSLPRGAHITGPIATRRRGRVLSAVHALTSSADQARQIFGEARDRLPVE